LMPGCSVLVFIVVVAPCNGVAGSADQQPAQQLLHGSTIGRIEHPGRIQPGFAQHRLGLAEGQETFMTMVVPHARRPYAAKGRSHTATCSRVSLIPTPPEWVCAMTR